jgi:hypothetical protein
MVVTIYSISRVKLGNKQEIHKHIMYRNNVKEQNVFKEKKFHVKCHVENDYMHDEIKVEYKKAKTL